jgi:hypothetical protein
VKKIAELAGEDPSSVDAMLTDLPPGLEPLAKAAKGEWIALDLVKAATAAKKKGLLDALPTAAASPAVDASKVQKLLDDLKKAYQEKATITELAKDDKRGQGYRLGAPAKQVALAISDDLVALVGKQSEASVTDAIKQIPDKTFSVDVWVKDEELTGVALDLTQFFDKPVSGHKLALDVGIDLNSGKVSAPSGATEINIDKLLEQFPAGALAGGLGGGPAVGSDFDPGTGLGDSDAGIGDPDTNVGGSATELTDAQIEMLKQSGMTKKQIKQLMDAQSGK